MDKVKTIPSYKCECPFAKKKKQHSANCQLKHPSNTKFHFGFAKMHTELVLSIKIVNLVG